MGHMTFPDEYCPIDCPDRFDSECWTNCDKKDFEDDEIDEEPDEYDDEDNGNICPECGHDCSK